METEPRKALVDPIAKCLHEGCLAAVAAAAVALALVLASAVALAV